MKTPDKSIAGVDMYYFDGIQDLDVGDLIYPGKFVAAGVYWESRDYPRFRVSFSDSVHIDSENAATELSDIIQWFIDRSGEIVNLTVIVFVHDFATEYEFKDWELSNVTSHFMLSNGCEFIAENAGEFKID